MPFHHTFITANLSGVGKSVLPFISLFSYVYIFLYLHCNAYILLKRMLNDHTSEGLKKKEKKTVPEPRTALFKCFVGFKVELDPAQLHCAVSYKLINNP